MEMVPPTRVETSHGSGREVITTPGPATTPQGAPAGPDVVVGAVDPGVGRVDAGLPVGGVAEEPQDARRVVATDKATSRRRSVDRGCFRVGTPRVSHGAPAGGTGPARPSEPAP
jgi:hypothetical protein